MCITLRGFYSNEVASLLWATAYTPAHEDRVLCLIEASENTFSEILIIERFSDLYDVDYN